MRGRALRPIPDPRPALEFESEGEVRNGFDRISRRDDKICSHSIGPSSHVDIGEECAFAPR